MKKEIYDGIKFVGIIDEDFNEASGNKEICKHEVIKMKLIMGDPMKPTFRCVKCGKKEAVYIGG